HSVAGSPRWQWAWRRLAAIGVADHAPRHADFHMRLRGTPGIELSGTRAAGSLLPDGRARGRPRDAIRAAGAAAARLQHPRPDTDGACGLAVAREGFGRPGGDRAHRRRGGRRTRPAPCPALESRPLGPEPRAA